MNRSLIYFLFLLMSVFFLISCQKENSGVGKTNNNDITVTAIVKVGGEWITEDDVNAFEERIIGQENALEREKIIQSLIGTKALKAMALEIISQEEIDQIEARSGLYKDELYVSAFLRQEIDNPVITQKEIEDFYKEHIENFTQPGGKTVNWLTIDSLENEQASDIVSRIQNGELKIKSVVNQKGSMYKQWVVRPLLMPDKLKQLAEQVTTQKRISVTFHEKKWHVMEFVSQEDDVVKPLYEVVELIRKQIASTRLKHRVKQAQADAIEKIKVERVYGD